jgi:hypothetical protein
MQQIFTTVRVEQEQPFALRLSDPFRKNGTTSKDGK